MAWCSVKAQGQLYLINRIVKYRSRLAGHVAQKGREEECKENLGWGGLVLKRPLGRPRRRREDNIRWLLEMQVMRIGDV
jgi:hypothetical protein